MSSQSAAIQPYSQQLSMNSPNNHYAFYDPQSLNAVTNSNDATAAAAAAGYSIQNILNFAAQQYAKSNSLRTLLINFFCCCCFKIEIEIEIYKLYVL